MTLAPTINAEIDFDANPTASYADMHSTLPEVISFWRMNSTSNPMTDTRGNNNGTLISTPATIAGPYLYDSDLGLTFDGANDSAFVASSGTISVGAPFAVGGWVRVASLPGSTVDLVTKAGTFYIQLDRTGRCGRS